MLVAYYLENGLRYRLIGYNEAPTGNDIWGIKWLRDRRRHVNLNGQGGGHI